MCKSYFCLCLYRKSLLMPLYSTRPWKAEISTSVRNVTRNVMLTRYVTEVVCGVERYCPLYFKDT